MKSNGPILRRRIQMTTFIVAMPFLLLLGYGFVTGMTDAALRNGWVPRNLHPVTEFYCSTAFALADMPLIGNFVRAGNFFGYDFAGGPETTR